AKRLVTNADQKVIRSAPVRRVHGWEGVERSRGAGGRAWSGAGGTRPDRSGNDLLLKPIRQSISACRSTREDVHLRPQSRWFEGESDGKVYKSGARDEAGRGAGGRVATAGGGAGRRAAATAGGGAGGRAAAAA